MLKQFGYCPVAMVIIKFGPQPVVVNYSIDSFSLRSSRGYNI